jgi:predicted  nucleic acid-binding Zn-ribbon protein
MLKSKTPDKDYPSNIGQKWTDGEEQTLLEELNKNINIELIAKMHNRTTGGIKARCKEIAYKLYINNMSIEEIILKTKLDEDQITETIKKRQNNPKKCKTITESKPLFSLESEIYEIKNDIKELKNTIKELVEMVKAVYDFEEA